MPSVLASWPTSTFAGHAEQRVESGRPSFFARLGDVCRIRCGRLRVKFPPTSNAGACVLWVGKHEVDLLRGAARSVQEKLVCRYCRSDDLSPSFIKRRDARCRACFKERYGSSARSSKPKGDAESNKSNFINLSAERRGLFVLHRTILSLRCGEATFCTEPTLRIRACSIKPRAWAAFPPTLRFS
jgi:hypothetical protein